MGNVNYALRSTSATTVLSSGTLSGSSDAGRNVSAAQSQTTGGPLYAAVEFNQAATTGATTAGAALNLYLLASVDDTNFAKGSSAGVAPAVTDFVHAFPGTSVAGRYVAPRIQLPPMDFKWCLQNDLGVRLSTGSNVLRAVYYTENVTTG